jgi:F0F1-type ATP synthase membrane subunit b/b'
MIRATASMLQAEAEALDDPDAAERLRQQAAEANQRLESLRSGSARWQTVLGDRVTDLSTEVTHRMRGSLRETSRGIEEQIEQLKTPEEWDGLARTLQAEVGEAVAQAFTTVELARGEIRAELAELLAADDVVGPTRTRELQILDTTQMWRSRDLDPSESSGGKAFRTGMTGLRGAQGGVLMLGVSGQFLPAAASVFIASNPVLLGAGALFGGFQLVEDRKRKLQARRQAARTQLRQFTDDVQFEVGNELTGLIRSVQRDLRDEFVELIGELQQSWTAAAKQAQEAASHGERAAAERLTAVRSLLDRCNTLAAELEAAGEEAS